MEKGLLNSRIEADPELVPSLAFNDAQQGQKVFCTLEKELRRCDSFWFSVAFITQSGLQMIKPVLKELEKRDVPGKVLTTDYLAFSQPDALDFLDSFSNLEVRMYMCDGMNQTGFHTKSYFFVQEEHCSMMIGSSNLTAAALSTSQEWNTCLYVQKEGALTEEVQAQFDRLWTSMNCLPYAAVAKTYRKRYALSQKQKRIAAQEAKFSPKQYTLSPNTMQIYFIDRLRELMGEGQTKALLVSATGTGKTYAAAFAMRELRAKRVLFLVHREQIARQAMESFETVLGSDHTYGLLGGGKRETDAQYLFSTVQTLSKENILHTFSPDAFDYIIIDEVHRAAAASYKRIFAWFHPDFWLGMSATPTRTDHESIYALFDYNVACSIGLRTALEEDLLCPFHYYALSDLNVDDETLEDPARFRDLTDSERIRHILEQANYYGYSGTRLKGLMFVSSIKEARAISEKLNLHGLQTMALSGEDSYQKREAAIERLTQDERDANALDYLITVDIFNEGVDIPAVNQVVLLRPTQSAIVFTQQLGRGLRKAKGKEFLVVLDFIGLYANNYLIPQALTESIDGNKDRLRRFIVEGNRTLPGSSTIYFDEVSRQRIFSSIDQASMNSFQKLKDGWLELYDRLGRIPRLVDFIEQDAMDPILIFQNTNYRCYPDFLNRLVHKEDQVHLTEMEKDYLRFMSVQWGNGLRAHELLAVQAMIDDPDHWKRRWKELCLENGIALPEKTERNVLAQLERRWLKGTGAASYPQARFLVDRDWSKELMRKVPDPKKDSTAEQQALPPVESDQWIVSPFFREGLKNPVFKAEVEDVLNSAIQRWKKRYQIQIDKEKPAWQAENGWFVPGETYTYADTFRLLDLEESKIANNVGGYMYDDKLNIQPVYINYEKDPDIVSSQAYEDHFLSPDHLIAYSKSGRTTASAEIERLKHADESGMKIPLFLRKNTNDGVKAFTYLGLMEPTGEFEDVLMKDGHTKAVRIGYRLKHPVRSDLYAYYTDSL